MSRRAKFAEEQKKFDARSCKRHAKIPWFNTNSGWCPSAYQISDEYSAFIESFTTKVQQVLENVDINYENANFLDAVIDSSAHIAWRELNIIKTRHLHSLMEIESTKKSQLFYIKQVENLLVEEIKELTSENM